MSEKQKPGKKLIPNLWIVEHTNKHGHDVYLVQSARQPSYDRVIKLFDIDFEPELDYLDINIASPVLVLSGGKSDSDKALACLHDIFSTIVEDGRVMWEDAAERRRALKAFDASNNALYPQSETSTRQASIEKKEALIKKRKT